MYPALNKAQRDRIRGALLEKVITRVRGDLNFIGGLQPIDVTGAEYVTQVSVWLD